MKYVLAKTDKAVAAGFDPQTHNTVDIQGRGNMMVITAKGMMLSPDMEGTEEERIEQLGGIGFLTNRDLDTYLYLNAKQ